jgi:ABC-type transporter Mla subunit MlaD
MNSEWVLIDREALLAELQQAFDAQTAEVLLRVLDKVAAQARAAGVTREDFAELRQSLQALAEAQQRTEQAVRELAEAQRRTEARVGHLEAAMERLAEAQRRTEERVGSLELVVKELAEAQQQTQQEVRELAEAQRETNQTVKELADAQRRTSIAVAELTEGLGRLRKQVGGLSESLGGDIEDIAYIVLYEVLKREFGWQVGVLERSWETWNDEPEEINVFGLASDPARPGQNIWIVGEAKHNLTVKEVERFARQVERARQHLHGEIFPVCFCYRARPEAQQAVRDAGLRLVFSYGKLV